MLTIEDPIELALPYATQIQVNKKAGLTFPALLRSSLRQDPDLILVGEMGDAETAQIAVEAALNGHLLLTTLQTGDAPSALLRLLDRGIEPHLIAATVVGVVASRLARRVCESCSQPEDLSADPTLGTITALAAEGGYEIPEGRGFSCAAQAASSAGGADTGGRIGLYEVLTLDRSPHRSSPAPCSCRGAAGDRRRERNADPAGRRHPQGRLGPDHSERSAAGGVSDGVLTGGVGRGYNNADFRTRLAPGPIKNKFSPGARKI